MWIVVTGCNRDINILHTLQDGADSTFFSLAVQWKSGQSVLDLLCNHFVFADVVLDSILMYVDLLIGFYKYCLGETVELGCDSIFIRQ